MEINPPEYHHLRKYVKNPFVYKKYVVSVSK